MNNKNLLIEINKIGKKIRDENPVTLATIAELNHYRELHIPIMRSLVAVARNNKLKPVIIARRLKRFLSIEKKLKRFTTMKLSQMQDIAGVRTVFNNVKKVYDFASIMQNTYSKNRNFKYKNSKDYINNPKNDGYRGIHQIFLYQKGQYYKENIKLGVELQIRTLLQHYWATAVEILSLKSSNIKLGEGLEYEKEFFRLCSVLIAYKENAIIHDDYKNIDRLEIIKRIRDIDNEYGILKHLSAIALTSKQIQDGTKNKIFAFYVMDLDVKNNTLHIRGFTKKQEQQAKLFYQNMETNKDLDVVLISLDKVKQLKSAYPNYFLDSKNFSKFIKDSISTTKI